MHGPDSEVIPLHPPFETVLRGFHRQQVVEHIEALEARLAMVEADRDAALGQVGELTRVLEHLRREAEDATARLELVQRSSLGGAGVRIQRMMQLAEHELSELRAGTEQETTAMRERARAEADELLRETTERCGRMEADAMRTAQEHRTRTLAGLHVLLVLAAQRLTERTTEAQHRIAQLTSTHSEVNARLSAVHRTLAEALDQIPPPPEQLAEPATAEPADSGDSGDAGDPATDALDTVAGTDPVTGEGAEAATTDAPGGGRHRQQETAESAGG